MFETLDFGKSLDEDQFDEWLERGRNSYYGYQFLLIVWDEWEQNYQPVYVEEREQLAKYGDDQISREKLVAVYDLYSESRVTLHTE